MFKIMQYILIAIVTLFTTVFPQPPQDTVLPEHPLINVNPNPIASPVKTQDLKIMSYNVKINGDGLKSVEKRMPLVADTILDHAPDSLGVQEADKIWVDGLSNILTDYDHVGVFRDDGKEKGESSTIFYLKDKYNLKATGNYWLSETPDVPSKDWDAGHYRILTYAILEDKATGFTYAHFNTHLDNASEIARRESVAVISAKIAEIAPDIPVVLTGDFNFEEGCSNYNNVLACGFKDTKYLAEKHDKGATYNGYVPVPFSTKPIDFIFVNGYVSSVKSYSIDMRMPNLIFPSDHFPIITEITLFN